jgi:hypothetical protein
MNRVVRPLARIVVLLCLVAAIVYVGIVAETLDNQFDPCFDAQKNAKAK